MHGTYFASAKGRKDGRLSQGRLRRMDGLQVSPAVVPLLHDHLTARDT